MVWAHVRELLTSPEALEFLATEYETARGALASRERDAIGTLDDRITGLEAEIANECGALRDEGFDPAVVRAAIRKRNDTLVRLKRQRQDLLRFRGKNLAAAGLAARLRALATQARGVLHTADDHLRRSVLDLLDVQVEVLGWEQCDTCQGKGLLARPGPRRRHLGTGDDHRRQPLVCPDCIRTRHIPRLHIGGHVPELLLVGLDAQTGSSALVADTGMVVPFEAEIRVA